MGMKLASPSNAAAAVAGVRQAIELLQSQLQNIPVGTELHKAVLKAVTDLAKHASAGDASPGIQKTAMHGMQQSEQQQAPWAQLMQAIGHGGASGAQPGAA